MTKRYTVRLKADAHGERLGQDGRIEQFPIKQAMSAGMLFDRETPVDIDEGDPRLVLLQTNDLLEITPVPTSSRK